MCCSNCHCQLVTVERQFSMKDFGIPLCFDCQGQVRATVDIIDKLRAKQSENPQK